MFSKFLQNRLHKINSPDDLMDLLSSFTRLLSKDDDDEDDMNGLNPNRPTHIAPRSIFGIFVRRIVLAVNKMLFDSVANLFNDVKKFLKTTVQRLPPPPITVVSLQILMNQVIP